MSATCPLCGLRYAGQPLLDLHIREDHAQRERGREPPAAPGDPPAATAAPEPASAPPPSREHPVTAAAPAATEAAPATDPAGLPGWAAAARRALSRLTRAGRETAGHPRQAA
jgi:hypothetical protein